MMIVLKVASGVGPLVGGVVASLFGIEWTLGLAILLIMGAVLPLLTSGEPVKSHQTLRWGGLFSKKHWRAHFAHAGIGIDQTAGVFIWPLVLGAFIFTENVYASVGAVMSFSFVVSIATSHTVGKIVDSKRGQFTLMNVAGVLLAFSHLLRVLVSTTVGVLFVGLISEVGVIGTRIQFTKDYYEKVDSLKGQRIASVVVFETVNAATRMIFWLIIAAIAHMLGGKEALYIGLVVGILGPGLLVAQNRRRT